MRISKVLSRVCGVVLFVIAATSLRAQDPLGVWARRDMAGITNNFNAIAFGNDVFVAVGNNSTVATSVDGTSWTVTTAGPYGNLARVRFLNGNFIALGSSDKILWSTNGAAWTARTLPSAEAWDVAYGDGTYVVAGSTTYASTNGVDWTATFPEITVSFGGPRKVPVALDSIVFGDGKFVGLTSTRAEDFGVPRHGVYSTNGVDWLETGNAPGNYYTPGVGDLLFIDGLFLGTGGDQHGGLRGVWVSRNGVEWCCGFQGTAGLEAFGVALAYGHGQYLWVENPGIGRSGPFIYSSLNGTSWVARVAPPIALPFPWDPNYSFYLAVRGNVRGAAFGKGTFVLVGDGGYILQSGNSSGTPLIIQQPEDRGAVVSNPANFSVTVAGSPPLGYQWYRNGELIPGATGSSYAIGQVVAGDTGGYYVVITNSFGSVTSRVAQLTVSFLDIKSYAGIEILGLVGRTYRIEATPANGAPNWQTLTNLVLPSSPYIWSDFGSPAAGQRIYRAAELP